MLQKLRGKAFLIITRDQSYYGRVLIALKEHGKEIADLSAEEGEAFMRDLGKASRAVKAVVDPAKINYGMFSDKLAHSHCHIVPKQIDGPVICVIFTLKSLSVDSKMNLLINTLLIQGNVLFCFSVIFND